MSKGGPLGSMGAYAVSMEAGDALVEAEADREFPERVEKPGSFTRSFDFGERAYMKLRFIERNKRRGRELARDYDLMPSYREAVLERAGLGSKAPSTPEVSVADSDVADPAAALAAEATNAPSSLPFPLPVVHDGPPVLPLQAPDARRLVDAEGRPYVKNPVTNGTRFQEDHPGHHQALHAVRPNLHGLVREARRKWIRSDGSSSSEGSQCHPLLDPSKARNTRVAGEACAACPSAALVLLDPSIAAKSLGEGTEMSAKDWADAHNKQWQRPVQPTRPTPAETANQRRDREEGVRMILVGGPFDGKAAYERPSQTLSPGGRGYALSYHDENLTSDFHHAQYMWTSVRPDGVHVYEYTRDYNEGW